MHHPLHLGLLFNGGPRLVRDNAPLRLGFLKPGPPVIFPCSRSYVATKVLQQAAAQAPALTGNVNVTTQQETATQADGSVEQPWSTALLHDVGGVVHLEHINLEVPDLEVARLFYSEGLGLTLDPDTTAAQRGGLGVVWYNVGRQQLHICKGLQPQNTGGTIHLCVNDLDALERRLITLQSALAGTQFSVQKANLVGSTAGRSVSVTCPWGQQYMVWGEPLSAATHRGIACVELPCHPGTAKQIGAYYQRLFGAGISYLRRASPSATASPTETMSQAPPVPSASAPTMPQLSTACSVHAQWQAVAVRSGTDTWTDVEAVAIHVGPGTSITFVEDASLGDAATGAAVRQYTGWHVALYVTHFLESFQNVADAGLLFTDHPFIDKSYSSETALMWKQYRLQDIVDAEGVDGNKPHLLYKLQHEVRSMSHPRFMFPLHDRGG